MLTGVELRAVLPGPALKQGAVDDQLGRGVQVLHDWYLVAEGAGYQGCVGTNHPGGGGLGDAVDLGEQPLGQVVPQVGQGQAHTQEQPQHPGPEGRQGAVGVDRLAQIQDIIASDPRATIHGGGLFLVELASTPKLSQEQTAILLSDTPPPLKHPQHPMNKPPDRTHLM